ncbi:aldose 1-epimerase family protein [Acinetobacter sp. MD2(2019)]|uniref:aldose 1-epimerase family protein n=1 Tax=Acinetobacter sp. MD2(2019) TaxID=2605273 RepID=UPI002D779F10|nr:aldose 1-epimerase family protein [Acinetobacter sp. MD2(2019)]
MKMHYRLALSAAIALSCVSSYAKTYVLTDVENNIEVGNWKTAGQNYSIEQKVLHGGKQEGSKVITITSPTGLTISLSPTRGMGLLHAEGNGIHLGWKSPVTEVVNPAYINLESRNGLGWLDGFNEMLVRCGYEWTGHPTTADGQIYTLHGKAQNTPASYVVIEIDDKAPYAIHVKGLIKESTFKKTDLQTMTELSYVPGENSFKLHDVLTNHADYAHDYQIIYHSNFSQPILEDGAKFLAPVSEVSPFNDYAKKGLKDWQRYSGPTANFDEMVFNLKPLADKNGNTLAALLNKNGDKGVAIAFNTQQLPVLTLWKNTDTLKQGYVTGIEPGTSYAYPVTIERQQNRVKKIAPGQSVSFDLTYSLLSNRTQVQNVQNSIQKIQGTTAIKQVDTPIAKE